MTSPLAAEASPLLSGTVEGQPPEPVAWTFTRTDSGRSFYTSLGHLDDLNNIEFVRLLVNGIHWAAGLPPRTQIVEASRSRYERDWSSIRVPSDWRTDNAQLKDYDGVGWYRCAALLRDTWLAENELTLRLPLCDDELQVWFNGNLLRPADDSPQAASFSISKEWIEMNDANLIVFRVTERGGPGGLRATPRLRAGENKLLLKGAWQFRVGDNPAWSNIPLPARYGTSPDMLFEP